MRLATSITGVVLFGVASAMVRSVAPATDRLAPLPLAPQSAPAPRIHYPAGRFAPLLLPDGQRRAVLSVLRGRRPLTFGTYLWDDTGIAAGQVWIRIDLARQLLSVFRAGHEIGSTVILFGMAGKPTPSGLFPVLAKARAHRSTLYDAEMPFMLRLTRDGVAIHASTVRRGAATHGCIGVPPDFARLLYDQMQVGDQVAIIAP